MLDQQDPDPLSTLEPSRLRERLLGACLVTTALLWILAGYMAYDLIGDPIPAHYDLLLAAAMALSAASVVLTVTYAGRRAYAMAFARVEAELETLREQVRQRDEAWGAINALIGPTGSNLRVLSPRPANGTKP